ncbi:small ribosomal subunit biogenesis GTPase RsgA [Aliiglaciecola sp. 3_MG-2023]|uniref:small ribosomal subunit biogenesis GTPase RsgA n=1 Tax=Aliiglaciecola sp. 3_MG-2023 TaxID=3062644 RepID=UPI0026E3B53A|nr:small ribosomal subunit biogenesis GTPase RsgA [Aliiglaciecola sp. 3_MG-2023]MDO6695711.1 small ribosomal subunit biogenesis GTPase RsgA [Aliiglaciecola sp. 3_MG-2023]
MAKKPKLTKKQKRQVSTNRQKRLSTKESFHSDEQLADSRQGTVIGRFGKHADVQDESGEVTKCHMRRTAGSVVCGDKVEFRPGKEASEGVNGIIELVHDRTSVLTRPDFYDGVKPIAANIDQIIIVSSVLPALSLNIIDRYLVASEDVQIQPILLLNKIEMLDADARERVDKELQIYRDIGYQVLLTSCKTGEGIDQLKNILADKISVFVGQSGVGKSSIVNQLLPGADEAIGDISDNSGLGQHTTTAAKMLHFPGGGDLIDSPGVREFALWHLPVEKVTSGFIEFRDYIGGCKFRDCKHLDDPGCIIKQAALNGEISMQRYESYHKILSSMEENRPNRAIPN